MHAAIHHKWILIRTLGYFGELTSLNVSDNSSGQTKFDDNFRMAINV